MSRESPEISQLREIGAPAVGYLVAAIKKRNYLYGSTTYSNLYPQLPAGLRIRLPRPVDPQLARIRSYWTLGNLREVSKPAVPFLTKQLVSDTSLRSFVTYALSEIGTNATEAVPELVAALGSTNRDLRFSAGEILTKIEPANVVLLTNMMAGLKSDDVVSRRFAGYVLGLTRPLGSQAEHALAESLADPDFWVRFRAANALFLNYPTNREFMNILRELDESPQANASLLYEVAQFRPATCETTTLIAESFRRFASRSSGNSYHEGFFRNFRERDSNAVPALIEALQDGQHARLRALAAEALGRIGQAAAAARPALEKAIADEDKNVKREAAKALNLISR